MLRSLFLLIVLAGTILLSYSYIYSHADHDCIGDDCPICNVLNLAREESEAPRKITVSPSLSARIPAFLEDGSEPYRSSDSGIRRQKESLIALGIRSNC